MQGIGLGAGTFAQHVVAEAQARLFFAAAGSLVLCVAKMMTAADATSGAVASQPFVAASPLRTVAAAPNMRARSSSWRSAPTSSGSDGSAEPTAPRATIPPAANPGSFPAVMLATDGKRVIRKRSTIQSPSQRSSDSGR